METIYRRRAEQYGLEPTIPLDRIVRMTIAIADGWKMWQLLEPEAVDEQMLEEMMEIFTTGYGVMSGALEEQAAQR